MTVRVVTERLAPARIDDVHRALDRPPSTNSAEGTGGYARELIEQQPGRFSYRLTRGRATILVHRRRTSSTAWETETETRAGARLRHRAITSVTLTSEGAGTRIRWELTLEGVPWSQRLFLRLRRPGLARLLDSEADRVLAVLSTERPAGGGASDGAAP